MKYQQANDHLEQTLDQIMELSNLCAYRKPLPAIGPSGLEEVVAATERFGASATRRLIAALMEADHS